MKKVANTEVRTTAKEKGVRLWEIAEHLKISDPTITRKLSKELPDRPTEKSRKYLRLLMSLQR
ncbi:hypothetical protein [Ruminococcus sp.]|uniref:hypothetical protein n=1 Tax=Ruminococcus sp. TaxID=41978 RepID=UPI003EFE46DF